MLHIVLKNVAKIKMVFFYVLGSIATCSARKLRSTDYIKQLTPFR